MWGTIKSLVSNVGGAWKVISLVLAVYGAFSTLMVRWYNTENKHFQKQVQEVSEQLLRTKENHFRYVQTVAQANSIAKEGGEAKALVDKQEEDLKHARRSAKVIPDDDNAKLLKRLSNDVNESARQGLNTRRND